MINKKHYPLIRTIYLYLFALVGLALLVIGIVRLVDLGLKMYIFTKAEEQTYRSAPPSMIKMGPDGFTAEDLSEMASACKECDHLTDEQSGSLTAWIEDYEIWKEQQITPEILKSIQRQKTASQAFSFILVGLPLYLYHWRIIRKETKNKTE